MSNYYQTHPMQVLANQKTYDANFHSRCSLKHDFMPTFQLPIGNLFCRLLSTCAWPTQTIHNAICHAIVRSPQVFPLTTLWRHWASFAQMPHRFVLYCLGGPPMGSACKLPGRAKTIPIFGILSLCLSFSLCLSLCLSLVRVSSWLQ